MTNCEASDGSEQVPHCSTAQLRGLKATCRGITTVQQRSKHEGVLLLQVLDKLWDAQPTLWCSMICTGKVCAPTAEGVGQMLP